MARSPYTIGRYCVYALMVGTIGYGIVRNLSDHFENSQKNTCLVTVEGNVEHPGVYRVPEESTNFEVLRKAGVRSTSDLTRYFLASAITPDQSINVGTLAKPVALKPDAGSGRLEFYYGDLSVIASDGRTKSASEGMALSDGDRIITEVKGQAEITLNTFSRIDIDEVSELTINNLGTPLGNKIARRLSQKSGICWYKLSYASKGEVYKIATPQGNITVGGGGGDFLVDVRYSDVTIHNIEGLLLIERPNGDALNIIAGQSAIVFADGRPIQVRSLTRDVNPNEKFSQLTKEKTAYMVRTMPFNMLFVGIPMTFYFVSVQFEQGKTYIVNVPHATTVDRFVQGVETLDGALLSGGPVFASTMVERIMNARVPRYSILTKNQMIRIITAIGGVTVDVDDKAAAYLKLKRGPQKINGEQAAIFIRPLISGWKDCEDRQVLLLKALFDRVRTGGLVVTTMFAKQLVTGVETNMTVPDIVSNFSRFNSRKSWALKSVRLPGTEVTVHGFSLFEADLEQCKNLLVAEETP